MTRVAEGGLFSIVLRVLLGLALLHSPARAREDSKPEPPPPAVDPYTRGERTGLDSAGYVSLGPFPWCEGITTVEIERELAVPILWVETEHFRIGSTLGEYKIPSDRIEKKRIAGELALLEKKFPGVRFPPGKLDPWLRLHLYASRIESVHAQFLDGFGFTDAEFGVSGATAPAPGPRLGMPMKYTVMLSTRRSSLARLVRFTLQRDAADPMRERLPGGSLFFGLSAESVESWGHETDSVLHCQVAANVAMNLVVSLREMLSPIPVWFEYGWAHVASRRVDERFTLYAKGTLREDADSWRWDARVAGLVGNDFAPSFQDLANDKRFADLSGPDHLVAWSKVTWMLQTFAPSALREYVLAVAEPVPRADELDKELFRRDRDLAALATLGGTTVADLEKSWRAWAAKSGSKR